MHRNFYCKNIHDSEKNQWIISSLKKNTAAYDQQKLLWCMQSNNRRNLVKALELSEGDNDRVRSVNVKKSEASVSSSLTYCPQYENAYFT